MLMPGDDAIIRQRIESWLEKNRLVPRVVGEFDDGALLMAFGQASGGYFPAPVVLSASLQKQYGTQLVGAVEELRDGYYAITGERRITHPALIAITANALQVLAP